MENNNTNINSQNENNTNSDSFYSYSYRGQENQERNPNYYERKEEEAYASSRTDGTEKTYTAGVPVSQEDEAAGTYTAGSGASQFYGSRQADSQPYANGTVSHSPYGQEHGYSQQGQSYGSSQSESSSYNNTESSVYKSSQDESPAYNGSPNESPVYSNSQTESPAYGGSQNENTPFGREQFYTSTQWNSAEGQDNKKDSKRQKRQKANKVKKPHGFGMTMAKCAAAALVFGLVSSTVFYGTGIAFEHTIGKPGASVSVSDSIKDGVTTNSNGLSATNVSTATTVTDVSDIVENVMPSIVSITNMGQEELGYDFFGRSYVQDTESAGSGIIIGETDDEIYIATNNHVVANATQLTVNFIDDQTVSAEVKGTDPSTDLAVISVKSNDIPSETMEKIKVATLGSSDSLKVGEGAVAIGNALGYGQSVTTGVISAMDREVTVQDEQTGASITNDLIQTSAAINPGNSGGALLNMNGEVIGINSVKYSDTQVEGMGFSIPISAAEPIINSLITRELVDESKSAYLGISGQKVTEELAVSFGMPEGLYITLVQENSAAAQAGINKGDVMTEFDGRKIRSQNELQDLMQYYEAGTEVEITLQSNVDGEWQERKVTAILGKKNE